MPQDHIRYDILAQDALRGVIRKVLSEVAVTGYLPGDHHFFITFLTEAPGVRISTALKERYPEQMTIVVQHQFWDLKVTESLFEIGLSFSDKPEKLVVPFVAIRGFYDPSVNFELEFDTVLETAANDGGDIEDDERTEFAATIERLVEPAVKAEPAVKTDAPEGEPDPGGDKKPGADVVSLDSFRKKN
ncbi:MAG: SspB family protein [Hoeflea sp.]|uniref:SspB family protein n=1 Tax=Hoeflea sp. TaxID=1940281 RepID=UPI0027321277|nr:SspB family protein [Hoeflea sp.]MDP2121345.1 SspB family protein [Hoeflea sp.]MDP3524665.1 SspB family protein [Hoeflea sp.]